MRYLNALPLSLVLGMSLGTLTASVSLDLGQGKQDVILEACRADPYRQFDFWLGDWEVSDTAGQVVGTNLVTRVASGCAVLESWRSARDGSQGNSLNWYDPREGKWHQTWVGLGLYLELEGGIEDGQMVLGGERVTERGVVIDRITWTPGRDGGVRQLWEVSRDQGRTWQVVFDGTYALR